MTGSGPAAAASSRFPFRGTDATVNVLVTVETPDDAVTVLEKFEGLARLPLLVWGKGVTFVHCRGRHRVFEKRRAVGGAGSGGEGAGDDGSEAVVPVAG